MAGVRAVKPDWVGRVDLDGEDAGAHDSTEDVGAARLARGVERALLNRVSASEVELDDITNVGCDGVWVENIALVANLDSLGSSENARDEGRSGSKGLKLNHFDRVQRM